MLEMIGNLLDNACKWAHNRVALTIELRTSGEYQLCVDDDGPGVDEMSRPQILARGTRLDEQTAGHGLGLGIVSDIVENVAGTLTLEDSPCCRRHRWPPGQWSHHGNAALGCHVNGLGDISGH